MVGRRSTRIRAQDVRAKAELTSHRVGIYIRYPGVSSDARWTMPMSCIMYVNTKTTYPTPETATERIRERKGFYYSLRGNIGHAGAIDSAKSGSVERGYTRCD